MGIGKPVDISHPLMRRFAEIVAAEDPGRRFLPTSASGPRFMADAEEFGQGVHWDVHGPWSANGDLSEAWTEYWAKDDALFRSETGAPGASDAALIREYLGDLEEVPGTLENPLWRRTSWWVEWPEFVNELGREPANLEEYVTWSQERQARALEIAFRACKGRFPHCGGFLIWMGHDSFPCAANTAIVDFHGKPKPAARVFKSVEGKVEPQMDTDSHR
jgi:beta-mannosidase